VKMNARICWSVRRWTISVRCSWLITLSQWISRQMRVGRKRVLANPSEIGSAESWVFAVPLYRIAGRSTVLKAATELGVSGWNSKAIVRVMKRWRGEAPPERIASCCYADVQVGPDEVANWFDKPLHWAEQVFTDREQLRASWPATLQEERQGCGIAESDPSPVEIEWYRNYFLNHGKLTPAERLLSGEDFAKQWHAASVSTISE